MNRYDEASGDSGAPNPDPTDRIITETLQKDRAGLSGGHNHEAAKARAMSMLAASAAPAVGVSGGYSSWLSKLTSVKGIVGTLGIAAVAGGIGYGLFTVQGAGGSVEGELNRRTEQPSSYPARSVAPEAGAAAIDGTEPLSLPKLPAARHESLGTRLSQTASDHETSLPTNDRIVENESEGPVELATSESVLQDYDREDSVTVRLRLDSVLIRRR